MNPTHYVRSGDVDLAIYTWGNRDTERPTVLLVHGYPDAAPVWTATAERLSEQCFVIAYDVRGAGFSSRPTSTRAYDLDHLVSDLAAVIDAECPKRRIHLVGHDWGAIQSWEAVTTERLNGRIASYTCISGPCLDHVGFWMAKRLKSGSPKQLAEVAKQIASSWYIGAFHLPMLGPAAWKLGLDTLWPRWLAKHEGISGVEASATQRLDGSIGVKLYRANFVKRLLNPQQRYAELPVHLILPRRDRFMVAEIWNDLPHWVPNLSRTEVDAGHWLQLSHPAWVAQKICDFIRHVEAGGESPEIKRHPDCVSARLARTDPTANQNPPIYPISLP